MHGNVCEWCRDLYTEKLPGGRDPEAQPEDSAQGSLRVRRGGCWCFSAENCRSAERIGDAQTIRSSCVGFRVALCPVR